MYPKHLYLTILYGLRKYFKKQFRYYGDTGHTLYINFKVALIYFKKIQPQTGIQSNLFRTSET